jgi:S-adenosylmethionine:tRNA ribosyltransferase-isomerase
MHSEAFLLSDDNSEKINKAKREGRRIIPVGTTSLRVLESCATEEGYVRPSHGMTSIFLKEAHEFKVADALITNFHTPKSTLFILVCGFCGYEVMHKVYCHAIEKEYKFFSYGDACFLEKG